MSIVRLTAGRRDTSPLGITGQLLAVQARGPKDREVVVNDVTDAGYVLGDDEPELHRLEHLSRLYRATTLAWITQVGLGSGMGVADLGCGLGDLTEMAADLVGPAGTVTGVDISAHPLRLARQHAREAGLRNVIYEQADITTWRPEHHLDAVIGRLILMHLADPVAQLARLTSIVKPGGVIAFQDVVLTTRRSEPDLLLVTAFNEWVIPTFKSLGRPVDMGLRLAAVFGGAGLEVKHLTAASPIERGGGAVGYAVMAGDMVSLLPHMERLGVVTGREVVPETFEQRLRAEGAHRDAVLVSPLMVGASARTPLASG